MTKRRFALAIVIGLLVAGVDLHGQTFTAQIQQFWNMLRTGRLVFTNINVTGGTISGVTITPTSPLTIAKIIGGTGTTSTLTLQSTSGVGTTGADIIFKVGNNGATEGMRISNAGFVGVGGTPSFNFHVQSDTNAFGSSLVRINNTNTGSGAYQVFDIGTGANFFRMYVPSENVALQEVVFGPIGTGMDFGLGSSNANRWMIKGGTVAGNPTGNLYAKIDNQYDIGATATGRPRTGYFATSLVTPSLVLNGVTLANAVNGVAASYKIARGATAFDGSNPTTVATGLTTVVSCTATLQLAAALTTGTAFVTHAVASGANVDFYEWVIAGTASTGTETFEWICVGT